MTKEEISEKHFSVPNADHEGICYVNTDWDNILNAMDEYAKQQAIAFAIHYAKSAIQNGYVKPSAVENDRMEERYNMFMEQQNKDNV